MPEAKFLRVASVLLVVMSLVRFFCPAGGRCLLTIWRNRVVSSLGFVGLYFLSLFWTLGGRSVWFLVEAGFIAR